MKAFLFPGQGSQFVGMAKELTENYTEADKVFEAGSDILGFDLKKAVFESTEQELAGTRLAQPAIFAASLAHLAALKADGEKADAVAGHSLGEYAAMFAAGVFDIETGFKAVKARGEIMAKAKNGGMAAVTGISPDIVTGVCADIENVWAVNFNSPVQTVIAGTDEALKEAETALSAKGAKRVIKLNVSAAFHTGLMRGAADEFREFAKTLNFNKPEITFYSNLTGGVMTDFSDLPDYFAKHMCGPVLFADELRAMKNAGVDSFIETGPGKALTGLIKKTIGGA